MILNYIICYIIAISINEIAGSYWLVILYASSEDSMEPEVSGLTTLRQITCKEQEQEISYNSLIIKLFTAIHLLISI